MAEVMQSPDPLEKIVGSSLSGVLLGVYIVAGLIAVAMLARIALARKIGLILTWVGTILNGVGMLGLGYAVFITDESLYLRFGSTVLQLMMTFVTRWAIVNTNDRF